jgi:hypothetical protein
MPRIIGLTYRKKQLPRFLTRWKQARKRSALLTTEKFKTMKLRISNRGKNPSLLLHLPAPLLLMPPKA